MRPDILRLVCAELPAPESEYIRQLPPTEFATHFEAYLAARRSQATIPAEVIEPWLQTITDCIDAGHHKGASSLIDTEPAH